MSKTPRRRTVPAPVASLTPARQRELRKRLLEWYGRSRRRLPWRRTRDPYQIWVSEVMLQQTTVKTAIPHYETFVERFPTVDRLAAASEEDVLSVWSGLGYYHRARNLHRGAKQLMEVHEGRFPRTAEAALAIPGVGLYTSSAVLSIAYGVPLPVVDGNVRRVFARLLCLRGPEWRTDGAYYAQAEELLDRDDPGDWNQALMELGATICAPKKPACAACPVRELCRGFAEGIQDQLPEPRSRRPPVDVTVAAAIIEDGGQFLLVRRAEGKLLGRLWEIPQTSLESRGLEDLVPELRERYELEVEPQGLAVLARHAITYRRIRAEGYRACLLRAPADDPERYKWATPEQIEELPISSLTKKLVRGMRSEQRILGSIL